MPKVVYKNPIERALKISLSKKGKQFNESHKLNIKKSLEGRKLSESTKLKMSQAKKGIKPKNLSSLHNLNEEQKKRRALNISLAKKGVPQTEEQKEKNRLAHIGVPSKLKGIKRPDLTGKNHWKWIEDRSKLKKENRRNDYSYKEWRKEVWLRDNFKCKIANPDCAGRIEAHHILSWAEHTELRYKISNGITLCHAHHPRKRAEEKRLIPTFMELVSVSNV